MFPPLQWDKFHLKAWSWLKGELFQGHVQFRVGCDLLRNENKVETIKGIHSLNLLRQNNLEGIQKPSQNDHLLIKTTCIGTLT